MAIEKIGDWKVQEIEWRLLSAGVKNFCSTDRRDPAQRILKNFGISKFCWIIDGISDHWFWWQTTFKAIDHAKFWVFFVERLNEGKEIERLLSVAGKNAAAERATMRMPEKILEKYNFLQKAIYSYHFYWRADFQD